MNYKNHYDLLVIRGKSRLLEGYSEKHHIIPRCMSGDNSEENLVRLTPEEHYLAHQLLVKIYPGNHKLVYAARMMSIGSKNTKRYNKLYGWIRRKHSIFMSTNQKGQTKENTEWRARQSKTRIGQTKENNNGILIMSEKLTGRTKETCPGLKSMSEKLTGRTKETHPGIKSQSEKMSGRTKETCPGLKASAEKRTGRTKETCPGLKASAEKRTGRTKETCPGVKAQSEKMSGRTKKTHEYIARNAEFRKKLTLEQELEIVYLRKSNWQYIDIQKFFAKKNIIISYTLIPVVLNRHCPELIKTKKKK